MSNKLEAENSADISALDTRLSSAESDITALETLTSHITGTITTYADNAAALAAGVVAGQLYQVTSDNSIAMCVAA